MSRFPYLTAFDLLLRYQRNEGYIATAFDLPLKVAEAHILIEIDVYPQKTSSEIAAALFLDKSTLSRAISRLVENRFITTNVSAMDKRRQELQLTLAGKKILSQYDTVQLERLSQFAANLTYEEQHSLSTFYGNLADGLGAHITELRRNEHPMMVQIRRITRSIGLLGRSYLNTGFSATQLQILSELADESTQVLASQLCSALQLAPNLMSAILNSFISAGLIKRVAVEADRRCYQLSLSKKGLHELRQAEEVAQNKLENALRGYRKDALLPHLRNWAKLIGESLNERGELVKHRRTVQVVEGEKMRQIARAFILEQLVRANKHLNAPEKLVSEAGITFLLLESGNIIAACEFQKKDGKKNDWLLCNFIALGIVDTHAKIQLLRESIRKVLSSQRSPKLLVPRHSEVTTLLFKGGSSSTPMQVLTKRMIKDLL